MMTPYNATASQKMTDMRFSDQMRGTRIAAPIKLEPISRIPLYNTHTHTHTYAFSTYHHENTYTYIRRNGTWSFGNLDRHKYIQIPYHEAPTTDMPIHRKDPIDVNVYLSSHTHTYTYTTYNYTQCLAW